MLFNLNYTNMNVLEKTNAFTKKAADQCVNFAGQVKNEAPGFFKNAWEITKKNKYAIGAIAAGTVLFIAGRYWFPKQRKTE